MRLQKYLSATGHCSRRKAEALMADGRVFVNNVMVTEMGTKVRPGVDKVRVDETEVPWSVELIYIVAHKPVGMISTLSDPEGRPIIRDLLPAKIPRVWPVGRLDWDSEGLVLLTNDGTLTHALTHPGGEVDKIYNVKLKGLIEHKDPALERLRSGVTLDDGFHTSSAQVTVESTTDRHTWVQIILHEGHNRQIRRMAQAVGYDVMKLRRVAIGPVELDPLPPRAWRFLTRAEAIALYKASGLAIPRRLSRRSSGPLEPQSFHNSKGGSSTRNKAARNAKKGGQNRRNQNRGGRKRR